MPQEMTLASMLGAVDLNRLIPGSKSKMLLEETDEPRIPRSIEGGSNVGLRRLIELQEAILFQSAIGK